MSYLHINNLYRPEGQDILLFKECYALEKIHGSSAHIFWDGTQLHFFSGGESHERFLAIFNHDILRTKFLEMGFLPPRKLTVYGEVYGGKCQGMSGTYGKDLKFIVFDINVDDMWLDVEKADVFTKEIGLEFVHYKRIPTTLEAIDAERDAPSVQAVRNGITDEPKKREGIVLRPLIELRKNNNDRIISKHKGDEFKETKTPREVDFAKIKILADAEAVAEEWVVHQRLLHVLDKLPGHNIERMREIIGAMVEDVEREAVGEIVSSEAVRKAIGKKTALVYKDYLKIQLTEKCKS